MDAPGTPTSALAHHFLLFLSLSPLSRCNPRDLDDCSPKPLAFHTPLSNSCRPSSAPNLGRRIRSPTLPWTHAGESSPSRRSGETAKLAKSPRKHSSLLSARDHADSTQFTASSYLFPWQLRLGDQPPPPPPASSALWLGDAEIDTSRHALSPPKLPTPSIAASHKISRPPVPCR